MSKEKKNRRDEHMTPAEAAEEALKEALEAETEAEQPAEPEAAPAEEAAEENPLAKQLEEANAKTAEYLAMAQRVQADFENYRKRNESVRADAYADVYQKLDVTPIDRQGEKFDPNLENAVLQGTEDEGEPGTVCQVLQKGYRMGDKVLRHAMVKVVPE